MSTDASVLLLHDGGELDDVGALLRGLGVGYGERQGAAVEAPFVLPRDLVVATARRAVMLPPPPAGRYESRGPARVAVVGAEEAVIRTALREAGFELLVRRPVHPTALRLLLLRLLYRGPERRQLPRVTIGAACRYRRTLIWRRSILTELSAGGCRLLAPRAVRAGRKLLVEIPDLSGGRAPIRVEGRVARANALSPTDPTFTLAIEFLRVEEDCRSRIAQIIADHLHGPASLPDGWDLEEAVPALPAAGSGAELEPTAPEIQDGRGRERRRHRRARYGVRVVTLGEEAAHIVMGRDLSLGGLRIEPHGGLERGQRLALAIHGAALTVPVVLRGSVIRDDGEAGLVISFEDGGAAQRAGLEKLLAGLGGIESLSAGVEGAASVLTRILSPSEAARI